MLKSVEKVWKSIDICCWQIGCKLVGKTGWKVWLTSFMIKLGGNIGGWTNWVDKLGRQICWKNWVEKLGWKNGLKNWVEKLGGKLVEQIG